MTQLRTPGPLLNTRKVADCLRVSRATVYRLLDPEEGADRLPAVRIGGPIRVPSGGRLA
jgi:predicted DNA-binding transcriptional regulator AlpA